MVVWYYIILDCIMYCIDSGGSGRDGDHGGDNSGGGGSSRYCGGGSSGGGGIRSGGGGSGKQYEGARSTVTFYQLRCGH